VTAATSSKILLGACVSLGHLREGHLPISACSLVSHVGMHGHSALVSCIVAELAVAKVASEGPPSSWPPTEAVRGRASRASLDRRARLKCERKKEREEREKERGDRPRPAHTDKRER